MNCCRSAFYLAAFAAALPFAAAANAELPVPRSALVLAQAATQSGKGEGQVRRIDKEAKKVTLQHGPLEGIDMPAMTMVFQVADPAMLDKIAVGNKVRFTVTRGGGAMTLQTIDVMN